ncbi:MAG: GAF domain-containing sensor histidine kinase [Bacteroidetes bacterium]|nr:GAF domain-containing sensor histidine kinase [Bacteroidota bacterium]
MNTTNEILFSQLGENSELLKKWENILNLISKVLNVPVALIMKVNAPFIEVFSNNNSDRNPYHKGDKEKLTGLYCETVINKRSKLEIPNALMDPLWDNNPDIKLGMIAYLGYPIHWPNQEVFGTLCILDSKETDFTDLHRELLTQFREVLESHLGMLFSNQELLSQKKLLELTNRRISEYSNELDRSMKHQDKLYSIIAHDLRNPLNTLQASSEILLTDTNNLTDDEKEDLLVAINNGASNMDFLLNNLLAWTRLHTGQIAFKPVWVNINDMLMELVELYRPSFSKKNIEFKSTISDDQSVWADQNMLSVVLRNLITNAIKYTKFGGEISVFTKSIKNSKIISITDDGIGMDEITIQRLFEIDKNSTPGTENERGTGLGLILSKEFIDEHGGELTVKSEPGKGSTFIISLPNQSEG